MAVVRCWMIHPLSRKPAVLGFIVFSLPVEIAVFAFLCQTCRPTALLTWVHLQPGDVAPVCVKLRAVPSVPGTAFVACQTGTEAWGSALQPGWCF